MPYTNRANTGAQFNGRTGVSKTFDVGSIPTAPAKIGIWCNDSINGSSPFGQGSNPCIPANLQKSEKSLGQTLYKENNKSYNTDS